MLKRAIQHCWEDQPRTLIPFPAPVQLLLLLLKPPDPLQHLESCPTETRTAKHLFGCLSLFAALGIGPQTDEAALGVDAMGFWALGVELVLGLDHSLLLRLPQLVPGVLPGARP